MPYWFMYSKNARKENIHSNSNRKFAEQNNSTMNRICKAFDDIGKINLNYAGIPQFNWQMLLSENCTGSRPEISQLFCELDNSNKANIIESQETAYSSEKQLINNYGIVAEDIERELTERYGSIENAYPYIAKYLFAGEGMNKSAHKQMFWRVFGEIALRNIRNNLASCDVCPDCGTKVPSWVVNHQCVKNMKGFYWCIDCGVMRERINPKQCRCEECQDVYKNIQKKARQRARREKQKAVDEQRITRLRLFSTET